MIAPDARSSATRNASTASSSANRCVIRVVAMSDLAANTSTAYAIQQWVTSTFTATTIGPSTVYDLTSS